MMNFLSTPQPIHCIQTLGMQQDVTEIPLKCHIPEDSALKKKCQIKITVFKVKTKVVHSQKKKKSHIWQWNENNLSKQAERV
jgi:hypothetical protein